MIIFNNVVRSDVMSKTIDEQGKIVAKFGFYYTQNDFHEMI